MKPLPLNQIVCGNVIDVLRTFPSESIHCFVTSPPYWCMRNYNDEKDQLGLEPTPKAYIDKMVLIFREVKRVLRSDGTLWVNIGDSYVTRPYGDMHTFDPKVGGRNRRAGYPNRQKQDINHKNVVGIPWMLAFAMREDGWNIRQDIIWSKPNPTPESMKDRCTKAHEYIFLFTKNDNYFYDNDAIREPLKAKTLTTIGIKRKKLAEQDGFVKAHRMSETLPERAIRLNADGTISGANKKSVWTVAPAQFKSEHFATFPTRLIEPCILAGTSAHGCCGICGAPYCRIVERVKYKRHKYEGSKHADTSVDIKGTNLIANTRGARDVGAGVDRHNPFPVGKQTGWKRTCRCSLDSEILPCVVCDPFMGAGTTAIVAETHGRNWVGSELNKAYITIADKRIVDAREKRCTLKTKILAKALKSSAKKLQPAL